MIFDGFTFFDEFDVLDIRLRELGDYVDHFVLVEATKTFSGEPKPLYFQARKHDYGGWPIIHWVVEDMPEGPNRWVREIHQRNAIMCPLVSKASSWDTVIISDVDEIPDKALLGRSVLSDAVTVFRMPTFYYQLNLQIPEFCLCSAVTSYRSLCQSTPHAIRERRHGGARIVDGGWHFSYIGHPMRIARKIGAFSHAEYDNEYFRDEERIERIVASGHDLFDRYGGAQFRTVPLSAMPGEIRNHPERYAHLLRS